MYTTEFFTALAHETGACCALSAAGGDCAHSIDPSDCYPSDEEMRAEGWYLDGGMWKHDDVNARASSSVESRTDADDEIPF
jgi:hypothetical protein